MATTLPAGPYRSLTTVEGESFPYYIIPFDKDGGCDAPRTLEDLLGKAGGYSDIFLFSHGWNNDWSTATKRYEEFIKGFQELRKSRNLKMQDGFKPLLVGIFWPSQAMEWFVYETGPGFAAADPEASGSKAASLENEIADIAAMLPSGTQERFYELARASSLNEEEARELAEMLSGVEAVDDDNVRPEAPSADDLLAAAGTLSVPEPDFDAVDGGDPADSPASHGPQAAGGIGSVLKFLDPRNLIKPFTVYHMKDRAGRVGAKGVKPLLHGLLTGSKAKIHILGHSYGCKVLMTAVCALPEGARKLHSALLFQPAVSQYAFANRVPERHGLAGGFHIGLKRVSTPIVCTFSSRDVALTRFYHLALRRFDDLGEQPQAANSPSKYGALGGFGPQDSNHVPIDIKDEAEPYFLGPGGRLIGVNGSKKISGHGDISNPATWWLAFYLATAPSV